MRDSRQVAPRPRLQHCFKMWRIINRPTVRSCFHLSEEHKLCICCVLCLCIYCFGSWMKSWMDVKPCSSSNWETDCSPCHCFQFWLVKRRFVMLEMLISQCTGTNVTKLQFCEIWLAVKCCYLGIQMTKLCRFTREERWSNSVCQRLDWLFWICEGGVFKVKLLLKLVLNNLE